MLEVISGFSALGYENSSPSTVVPAFSTNPLERLNREIKRHADVVGVFPNPEALLRLTTMVLIEQHDEWAATNRRYLAEGGLASLTHPGELDEGVTRQLNIV
jgi:hypothetical protein